MNRKQAFDYVTNEIEANRRRLSLTGNPWKRVLAALRIARKLGFDRRSLPEL